MHSALELGIVVVEDSVGHMHRLIKNGSYLVYLVCVHNHHLTRCTQAIH